MIYLCNLVLFISIANNTGFPVQAGIGGDTVLNGPVPPYPFIYRLKGIHTGIDYLFVTQKGSFRQIKFGLE